MDGVSRFVARRPIGLIQGGGVKFAEIRAMLNFVLSKLYFCSSSAI